MAWRFRVRAAPSLMVLAVRFEVASPFFDAPQPSAVLAGVRTLAVVERLGIRVCERLVIRHLGGVMVDVDQPSKRAGVLGHRYAVRHSFAPKVSGWVGVVHLQILVDA